MSHAREVTDKGKEEIAKTVPISFKLEGVLTEDVKPTTFGDCPIHVTAAVPLADGARLPVDLVIEDRSLEFRIWQSAERQFLVTTSQLPGIVLLD